MQEILDRIIGVLSALCIYSLDSSSLLHAEIEAYAHIISIIKENVEQLFSLCFIDGENEEYMKHWCKLLNLSITNPELDDNDKWAVLKVRKSLPIGMWFDYCYLYPYFASGEEQEFEVVPSEYKIIFKDENAENIFDFSEAMKKYENILPVFARIIADAEPPTFQEL
ncbi:MAG: hypothetical protein K5917_00460, partial [Clostridiales bacterium]|nr:hypothetical protein [Clostridiales bacterium]